MSLFKNTILTYWKNRGKDVKFGFFSRILPVSKFEGHNKIGKFSIFKGELGRCSYIGDNSIILGRVGRYTSIADRVHVISGRHPLKAPFVSTHPVFYAKTSAIGNSYVNRQLFEEYQFVKQNETNNEGEYSSIIGNDCWIGEGASIIGGVVLGDGAVVLANATVTKNVPPYAIVAGVPAKITGYRYSDEEIKMLLEKKWWEKEEDYLRGKSLLFSDLSKFLEDF